MPLLQAVCAQPEMKCTSLMLCCSRFCFIWKCLAALSIIAHIKVLIGYIRDGVSLYIQNMHNLTHWLTVCCFTRCSLMAIHCCSSRLFSPVWTEKRGEKGFPFSAFLHSLCHMVHSFSLHMMSGEGSSRSCKIHNVWNTPSPISPTCSRWGFLKMQTLLLSINTLSALRCRLPAPRYLNINQTVAGFVMARQRTDAGSSLSWFCKTSWEEAGRFP